jgi:glycosyltransferase involved in cell wall biosynthesis
MTDQHANRRVAYLLKTFPRLSETFILNEILGLERLGIDIQIFSLKKPEDGPVQPAVAQVKATVTYVPSLGPRFRFGNLGRLLLCHLMLLLVETRHYCVAAKFHFFKRGKSRLKDYLQAGYLAWVLRRNGFEHLHVHFANVPASVAEVVQRFIGIPYSLTAHAKDIYLTSAAELARKIEGAECVLTCTAHNQRYLAELAAGRTPVRLAYHGVDVSRFGGQSAHAPTATGERPLIVSVGRFCEKKGFEYLIRACRILADCGCPFHCQIVGYGELQNELERLIEDLGLQEFVELPGTMTQDQLAALYPRASMFVLPCLITGNGDRDGIPNVLIEAMASGVPVISTDVSGISELVRHQENGLLVEQRDADAIAEAMEFLLLHPDVRSRLARNGRETVLQRFTLEASALRVHDILRSVLDQSAPLESPLNSKTDLATLNTTVQANQ